MTVARYRKLEFVRNPFVGDRIVIGALVEHAGKVHVAKANLSWLSCLGGAALAHTVRAMLEDITAAPNFAELPYSVGAGVSLGHAAELPVGVENPVRWVESLLTVENAEEPADSAKDDRAPDRAKLGHWFFRQHNVHKLVRRKFDPSKVQYAWAKSITFAADFKPVSHWVAGDSGLLLMEPISLRRDSFEKDVNEASTTLTAYSKILSGVTEMRVHLIAYLLHGADQRRSYAMNHLRGAGQIVDTSAPTDAAKFIKLIKDTALTEAAPELH